MRPVPDDAPALIHQTARGYPRAVNNLAARALITRTPDIAAPVFGVLGA